MYQAFGCAGISKQSGAYCVEKKIFEQMRMSQKASMGNERAESPSDGVSAVRSMLQADHEQETIRYLRTSRAKYELYKTAEKQKTRVKQCYYVSSRIVCLSNILFVQIDSSSVFPSLFLNFTSIIVDSVVDA